MRKQLILISDMEGASGIFDQHQKELLNGEDAWREQGREKMTSDILAVCDAANEFGIDEILYYDGHFAGNPEFNVIKEKLPSNVRYFDVPDRCFDWRRIRGQAEVEPFGLITVGQHARNGEKEAYFAHTIQSPPIKALLVNDLHVAEIGMAILNFQRVPYIANIGCAASEREALELSPKVKHISVKDKGQNWEPNAEETYPIIKKGVLEALENAHKAEPANITPPYHFKLDLCKYFYFKDPESFPWKGSFTEKVATWEAPSIEMGFELFHYVRENISISEEDKEKLIKERLAGTYDPME
ncbi:M55 family metallopeptidase [Alkalicella caledoniensis]|uniref:M55 family metallopeptidase n=1 Tax=Alkalicella caledoniensis TaxID=2731377 RepID=A0A7G9W6W9_ALKCA|nr:M55 family metallopeptidase [Alkalicella caledoniensis]QNO14431.1 M55 family metallopeptidase [Alkalicella caledoniensis]